MGKEECLKELRNMCKGCEYKSFTIECSCGTKEVFEELINEHFDNTPLKFEELEIGMWVWDNLYKNYVRVTEVLTMGTLGSSVFVVRIAFITPSLDTTIMSVCYEENRFYRYEVKG